MKFIPYTLACLAITSIPFPVQSQIKPDPRATEPSIIENGTISGGLSSGENLFHSFEQFNVKVNETVRFENPDRIHNIFSQITGNDPSTIAGTIQVNGPANLILLNPNGIIFTPTAKLDLQGAFTATTASDVILEDDSRWNASNPNRPTLTISTPIGLGFYNQNGQGIIVKDVGQQSGVINESPERIQISNPIIETNTEQGLINSSINLIGNQVILNNGIVATPSGQLTIGSILEGTTTIGNLSLKTDFIILDEGEISSVAEFRGDGGNLNIDANTIVGKNESQILANSQNGQGGQITIDTKYLFGFMFRDTTGDEIGLSEITAISLNDPELNGNVSISENNFFDRIETTEINLRPIEQINPPQCLTQSNGESRFRRRSTNGTSLLLPKWESNQIGNTIIQKDDRTYLVNSQSFQNCN
ncbi:UNVERIFIED_CONTAM: hypothetical protein BEN50_16245 [Euhalothece sp. KZN 001]